MDVPKILGHEGVIPGMEILKAKAAFLLREADVFPSNSVGFPKEASAKIGNGSGDLQRQGHNGSPEADDALDYRSNELNLARIRESSASPGVDVVANFLDEGGKVSDIEALGTDGYTKIPEGESSLGEVGHGDDLVELFAHNTGNIDVGFHWIDH